MRKITAAVFSALIVLGLFAAPARAVDIHLSVAASLRETVTELAANFTKKNPQVKFMNNFGASGALAKQIESGAPADLFFSANLEWMDYLKVKRLMDEKNIGIFAFNTLVFVGMPEANVRAMQDLAALDRIAIGSPKSVPAGEYALEALRRAGMAKQVEKKLVMAKDVRECLLYADRGEVSGAFVYKTDAEQAGRRVKILFTVPQELYPRVTYPVGLTATGSRNDLARAFYAYLQSAEAKAVVARYGFALR